MYTPTHTHSRGDERTNETKQMNKRTKKCNPMPFKIAVYSLLKISLHYSIRHPCKLFGRTLYMYNTLGTATRPYILHLRCIVVQHCIFDSRRLYLCGCWWCYCCCCDDNNDVVNSTLVGSHRCLAMIGFFGYFESIMKLLWCWARATRKWCDCITTSAIFDTICCCCMSIRSIRWLEQFLLSRNSRNGER